MFFVNVLKSEGGGRYYVGCTKDVDVRLSEHNAGKMVSTKGYRPWRVVRTESYGTLAEARRREQQIKAWKNPGYMAKMLGLGE